MVTDAQREQLYALARSAGAMAEAMVNSWSGSDRAESERYYGKRRVYVAVAGGKPLEEAIKDEDARWRAYAAEQARKVAEAPRVRRGPRAGHSSIDHRWVSPEAFQTDAIHLRMMINGIINK